MFRLPKYIGKRIIIFGLLTLVAIYCGSGAAEKSSFVGRSSVKADVVGTWVGVAVADLFVYRITFDSEGGLCGRAYTGKTIQLYKIESWNLSGESVVAQIADTGTNDVKVIVAEIQADVLRTTIRGNDWKHELVLYKEDSLEKRLDKLRQAMRPKTGDQGGGDHQKVPKKNSSN